MHWTYYRGLMQYYVIMAVADLASYFHFRSLLGQVKYKEMNLLQQGLAKLIELTTSEGEKLHQELDMSF